MVFANDVHCAVESGLGECRVPVANFYDLRTGSTPLARYAIETYDDIAYDGGALDIAFSGISTPETLTKSAPSHFQDALGAYIYGFCQDDTGEVLCACV